MNNMKTNTPNLIMPEMRAPKSNQQFRPMSYTIILNMVAKRHPILHPHYFRQAKLKHVSEKAMLSDGAERHFILNFAIKTGFWK